jgi:hypothetical protein
VKDKPTNDKQNKCLVIFSPEAGNYSWVEVILVQSIDEFPKPIPYKTYQEGLKMVQDLGIARWFIMQKLAVEMLYMVDQLHLNVCFWWCYFALLHTPIFCNLYIFLIFFFFNFTLHIGFDRRLS